MVNQIEKKNKKTRPKLWFVWLCSFLLWASTASQAFYLPGSYPHSYLKGNPLWVKVNSITSVKTEMPFSYYSLPFCKPTDGIKDSAENLGELLMGDRIQNSPYRFKTNTNETDIFLCSTGPSSADQTKNLTRRIDELYQVNLILDNLPVIQYTEKEGFTLGWTGYPIGLKLGSMHYIFNHLKFKFLIHIYEDPSIVVAGDATIEMIPGSVAGMTDSNPGYIVVGFAMQLSS